MVKTDVTDAPLRMSWPVFSNINNIQAMVADDRK